MFDARFRRLLPTMLGPVARVLARAGVTPNALSLSGGALGIAAGVLIARGWVWTGIITWLVSRLVDGLDGILARESQQASPFGGYLDITVDMAAYCAMLLGFAARHPEGGWVWSVILVGYVLVTTTTLALSSELERVDAQLADNDRSIQFTPGFAEAGETTTAYVLFALFPAVVTPIAWGWAALCFATVVQRTRLARRLL
jgi:phosphatidylglycerophosphate synthase